MKKIKLSICMLFFAYSYNYGQTDLSNNRLEKLERSVNKNAGCSTTTPVSGLTNFNSVPSSYTEYSRSTNAAAGIIATNVACTGWNMSGYTTTGSDAYIIGSENWGGTASDGGFVELLLESGTQTILTLNFKSTDGKLFDLNTIDLGYDGNNNVALTITGYKSGVAVPGATFAVPAFNAFGFAGTWKKGITVSSNTKFKGIDEFRITPNTANQLWGLYVDNINATNFTTLSTTDFEKESKFVMYPNPATSKISIKSGLGGDFYIISALGQIVKTFTVDANTDATVNVSDLNEGVYFVKAVNASNTVSQKLIIQKK
jgi:hypothetical protein